MPFRAMHIAFTGPRPDVKPGDRVECRTAGGEWFETRAHSVPRYEDRTAIGGKAYLTVAVEWGGTVANWPAEDVRPIAAEPTSSVDMLEVDRGE